MGTAVLITISIVSLIVLAGSKITKWIRKAEKHIEEEWR